jgi:outer membrane protein OmpA-like peptidoglycan-associated protein
MGLLIATVGLTGACATRRYARDRVSESAQTLTSKMEEQDKQLQGGIDQNTGQITELNSVSRDHTQQLGTLNGQVKQVDDKAGQALNVGQGAQKTATQAQTEIASLDQKFANRNNYMSLKEENIPFKFNSATLDKTQFATLDAVADQLKNTPDAILVLEGRTDNTGDAAYNVQLGDRRLEAVVRYLVVEKGVPMQKVYKMSYGEDQPMAPNDSKENRAQNRSVVVKVLGPGERSGQMLSQSAPQS